MDGAAVVATANRLLPPFVTLILALLIGWQIARMIWMLVPAPAAGEPVSAPPGAVASERRMPNGADVGAIAAAHLFGEADADDAIVATDEPVLEDLPETRVSLVLKGTVASRQKDFSVAVISSSGAEDKVYSIDDTVMQGVTLHSVYADRVVLDENGTLTNLKLPREFAAASVRAPVRRQTTAARQNTNSIQTVVSQNLTKLTDVIRPTPYMVQGKPAGYRVYPGRNREQFAALGLRPGDIIKDIDGQSLTDPTRAMQIFQSLGTADQVSVTVERNGQTETLVLSTSQLDLGGEQ